MRIFEKLHKFVSFLKKNAKKIQFLKILSLEIDFLRKRYNFVRRNIKIT